MRQPSANQNGNAPINNQTQGILLPITLPRKTIIAVIMMVALFAFEIFNFDTTRYALLNLLGDVKFLGLHWAGILAIAFCAIDFAGLARLFTPQQGAEEPKAVWYLMGAWLLGATMNAIMTWWAVSLTLLAHDFGNEVLSRTQLLQFVPIFVATLVWLTRILFIGAFSVAGEHLFDLAGSNVQLQTAVSTQPQPRPTNAPQPQPVRKQQPTRPDNGRSTPPRSRINQRPPAPGGAIRRAPVGMQARKKR
ncbi:MAG: hypothetical protein GY943_07295 [Chloroflexi bacterium]|nr:hypothetical protein [Chloroflexota bacterium]